MRRHLALLAAVLVLVAACDSIPLLPRSDALLVTVELSGGECPDGMCTSRFDVHRDGRVVAADGGVRRLDADTMGRLITSIEAADWDAILARPFTGECPTAYDGQETTYTFQTASGAVTIASCTTEIDPGQEPFATLDGIVFGAEG